MNKPCHRWQGILCGGASDAHAAQRIHDIAQGAGDRRVFDFEALDRQVHAVGDARVLCGSFQLDFRFDLRHQRMQIFTLGFRQRWIVFQLLAQGIELFLQFLGGLGGFLLSIGTGIDRSQAPKVYG